MAFIRGRHLNMAESIACSTSSFWAMGGLRAPCKLPTSVQAAAPASASSPLDVNQVSNTRPLVHVLDLVATLATIPVPTCDQPHLN